MRGTIFNIQRFSLFDGPGVRTVVFLKGCPLHCSWCHNPEGIYPSPQVLYDPEKCIECGVCVRVCPEKLHSIVDGLHLFLRNDCSVCGACVAVCPSEALSMAGRQVEAVDVLQSILLDTGLFLESGGGLTLSGGEPLFQPKFSAELLRGAKEYGLHTCVETSGQAPLTALKVLLSYADLFYFDWKITNPETLKKLCGANRSIILANLAEINYNCIPTVLRCLILPGINDQQEHFQGIAEVANRFSCVKEIHLMPYHRLGSSKLRKLGKVASFDCEPPDREKLVEISKLICQMTDKEVCIY